jgi:PmbA protein
LVTRFHYTHCPDPMRVVATGTTRDGTFLIEDGQIVARLKNLRFTDSVLTAFSRVSGISPDRRLARDWWSSYVSVLPAIRVDGFHFTGATTF